MQGNRWQPWVLEMIHRPVEILILLVKIFGKSTYPCTLERDNPDVANGIYFVRSCRKTGVGKATLT